MDRFKVLRFDGEPGDIRIGSQPFCDGSHAGTGLSPVIYKAENAGTAYFCGCKATRNKPMCDGSHKELGGR